ncbi:LOW QUALITY PROTEIN: Protein CBG21076 [Caenorhabditis briggsae]|uniref:Protein CBG21076 n=1 Tax=Caenorhabditis briggsae TaxID=6238 RepID=A8XZ92_CAEBR|nr:LOW QUALITY PROTEIN: Protein CBG21076 [Caenorhabditis briggsae]CAP37959.1 Protein CBG21076 [Caenorhabditis briggsae]
MTGNHGECSLHSSYKADPAKIVRVKKCDNEDCDCSTNSCDNYICPKSCALKKAGCKNQVFEEYRQLRGKRFFAKSSEDKGTGQNEFIIPYNGEIIISIPELQIRIQGKW